MIAAPVGTVFPDAVIPLQHDLLGWVLRVEINVSEEDIAFGDRQRLLGCMEKVLR